MKILMTTDLYTPTVNGVVTSIRTLKEALEEKGHEVMVLTLSETEEMNTVDNIFSVSSINLNKVYPGARLSFSANHSIYSKLIEWKPDIIHSHCEFSTFRMAKEIAEELNIPIVHTYHTVYEDYTHYFSPNKKVGEKIVSLFSRRILNQTDLVIAPTDKVKQLLNKYQVSTSIEVVPTGINTDQFNQSLSEEVKQSLKKQHGIQDDDRVLLFIGRIAKEKNIAEVVTYLSRMNLEQVKFLVCGDGPYREELESYVASLNMQDRVIFTGMINPNQVPYYYQIGDVFISASTSETQGLTYLEALLSGVPLLCRKDECLDNVVYKGVNGYLFTHFKEFESCLTQLLSHEDERKAMGEAARIFAQKAFSAQTFGNRIEALYDHVLFRRRQSLVPVEHSHKSLIESIRSWV